MISLQPWIQPLAVLLPLVQLVVALLFAMAFGGTRCPPVAKPRMVLMVLVLALHALWLVALWNDGAARHPFWVSSGCGFALALCFAVVQAANRAPASTGALVFPVVFLLQLGASAFGDWNALGSSAPNRDPHAAWHAVAALLAVSSLLLSGLYGLLYLVQCGQIRRQRFGVLFRALPDLPALARLNRASAFIGFLFLSLGLNLGIWWAHQSGNGGVDYTSVEVWPAIVLWIVFGLIGASRWISWISGRHAAWVATVAASVLVLATLVMFWPGASIHSGAQGG